MGENNYKIFQVDSDDRMPLSTVYGKGDVNNDGFNDILINEPEWSGLRGRAFLFYGGKDIVFSSPDMIFEGEKEGDGFGGQAGVFADINNDGNDDVIIGASGTSTDPINRRVYVFYCGPDMDTKADIILDSGVDEGGRFGYTVTAADIDNDGYNDVLVGSQYHNQRIGGVYLFWGGKTMDTIVDMVLEGEAYSDAAPILSPKTGWMVQGLFGRRIDASGDVNGDGYKDILIGARYAGGKKSNGAAYLFFGNKKEDMNTVYDCAFRGENANDEMGSSLDLFDIDNDGFSDVIVGARFAGNYRGAVYIWWGGKDFDGNGPADAVLEGEPFSNMGGDDLVCGDFNNDGYLDALIGADGGNDVQGKTFLYFGPFATEDLQDKIKAQQKRVKEIEQQLSKAKQRLSSIKK